MSDQYVQVAPDSTGKKIQTFENTVSGETVEAQAVVLVDSTGVPISLPEAAVVFSNPGGRLTLESGVPVSTTDQTAKGTLYYAIYKHNNIYTYDGAEWQQKSFSQISLTLSITSGKNYDVFINSDADTLSLSSAWSDDTTRAVALGTQDGVTVLNSDPTKLWLGTIRASGSNVTEDSAGGATTQVGGKRFVWNRYNQEPRPIKVIDTTDTWAYQGSPLPIRQANGAAGNKVEYVTGDLATNIVASIISSVGLISNVTYTANVGVGVDSTTTFSGINDAAINNNTGIIYSPLSASYSGSPGLGYHYISWNEHGADGTCVFIGDEGTTVKQSGLIVQLKN